MNPAGPFSGIGRMRTPTYFPMLDAMRGVAALMVVIYHSQILFGFSFPESFLAVDIFFVLSGVVVANAYEAKLKTKMSVRNFMLVRLVRLYPLYFLSIVISIVTVGFLQIYPRSFAEAAMLTILSLLILPMPRGSEDIFGTKFVAFPLNPPAWSLFFELLVNLLYAALLPALGTRLIVTFIGASAAGIIFEATRRGLDVGWSWHNLPAGTFRVIYSFFAGVILYRFRHQFMLRFPVRFPSGVAAALILSSIVASLCIRPPAIIASYYEAGIILLLFPMLVQVAIGIVLAPMAKDAALFFGVASYSIYVLHEPLLRAVVAILRKVGIENPPVPLSGVLFTIGLVALSAAIDKWFDTPVRAYLLDRLRSQKQK